MQQRVLTPQELKEIIKLSNTFAKDIRKRLRVQIQSMDLRSQSEVFARMKDRNKVDVHLAESFKSRVKKRYGQVESIHWIYNWYGLFHDVGAQGPRTKIKERNWSDKAITPKIKAFQNNLADFYANVAVDAIVFTKKKTA